MIQSSSASTNASVLSIAQHRTGISAAIEAGIKHVVYTVALRKPSPLCPEGHHNHREGHHNRLERKTSYKLSISNE